MSILLHFNAIRRPLEGSRERPVAQRLQQRNPQRGWQEERGRRHRQPRRRDETRPVSTGGRDETCPVSTGGRGGGGRRHLLRVSLYTLEHGRAVGPACVGADEIDGPPIGSHRRATVLHLLDLPGPVSGGASRARRRLGGGSRLQFRLHACTAPPTATVRQGEAHGERRCGCGGGRLQ